MNILLNTAHLTFNVNTGLNNDIRDLIKVSQSIMRIQINFNSPLVVKSSLAPSSSCLRGRSKTKCN